MDVFLLLDVSQSMNVLITEAVGSINGYVKKLPKTTNVTLVIFDSTRYQVIRKCKVSAWSDVHTEETKPLGSTPLYDSCAKLIIQGLCENPEKAVLVVMTDGYENMSRTYSQNDVKNLLSVWERLGYEAVFLGANFDDIEKQSSDLGISSSKVMNYGIGNFEKGMDFLSGSTLEYATRGVAMNFSAEAKASLVNK